MKKNREFKSAISFQFHEYEGILHPPFSFRCVFTCLLLQLSIESHVVRSAGSSVNSTAQSAHHKAVLGATTKWASPSLLT